MMLPGVFMNAVISEMTRSVIKTDESNCGVAMGRFPPLKSEATIPNKPNTIAATCAHTRYPADNALHRIILRHIHIVL